MSIKNYIDQKGFWSEQIDSTNDILSIEGVVSGQRASTSIITGNSTLESTSHKIYLINASSGRVVLTLPDAAQVDGILIIIKKTDTTFNEVQINTFLNELIDGSTSKIITEPYVSITLVSNGGNWWII